MKKTRAALAAAVVACALAFAGTAQAQCIVQKPLEGNQHSKQTRLDTMTADQVELTGGCMDGVAIGQNNPAAGNFSTLTVNGNPVSGGSITSLPTNCDGQAAGTVYNNNGQIGICTTVTSPGKLIISGTSLLLVDASNALLVR